MRRHYALEAAVFVTGITIGIACANDSNAAVTGERVIPDDTAAVAGLLRTARGSNPLVCEMTVRAVDMHGSWSNWGSIGGDALMTDSASAALLNWVQRSHNDPELVPPLRAALRDQDACVRRVASSLLARVDHPTAIAALLTTLDDAQPATREISALGLGLAHAGGAVDALVRRLGDGAAIVRRASAWALGELEAKKAVPALLDLLARDPDARVRQSAAWAIGSIH